MELIQFKNEIWDSLRTITESMDTVFRPVNNAHGLTMMQIRLLAEIQQQRDNCTVGSLGKQVSIACGNISSMCKRLEAEGLLHRTRSKRDERVVHLQLTERGQQVLTAIDRELTQRYAACFNQYPKEDFDMIINGLHQLNHMLLQMTEQRQREELE